MAVIHGSLEAMGFIEETGLIFETLAGRGSHFLMERVGELRLNFGLNCKGPLRNPQRSGFFPLRGGFLNLALQRGGGKGESPP